MKTLLLQLDIAWNDAEENIRRAERMMAQHADVDLFVLPEMWSTGFMTHPEGKIEEESNSVALNWMKQKAKELDCALSGSLAVRDGEGLCRNRHYFVTPSSVAYYDKRHLFSYGHEQDFYTAGKLHQIVSWRGFRFLLLTCYDLRFPVWSRYGLAGEYDAVIVVANWPARRQDAWEVLTRARAIENQCYLLAVNRVGDDPVGHYDGGTVLIDPIGNVVARAEKNTEQPIEGLLSMETLLKRRSHFRVLDDRDSFLLTE